MKPDTPRLRMALVVLRVGLSLLISQTAQADRRMPEGFSEEVMSKVALEVKCALDRDAEYDVLPDTALKIKVGKNRLGIAECFIYPKKGDGCVWFLAFDTSGKLLSSQCTPDNLCSGQMAQVGKLPCAAIFKWRNTRITDNTMHISFVISTDKARVRDEAEGALAFLGSKQRYVAYDLHAVTPGNECHLPLRMSKTDRMTTFVRVWSEVERNFAFFERMPELNWDKVLVDYLPRVEKAETMDDFGNLMREMVALLKDGHTNYEGFGDARGGLGFTPPMRIRGIGGKAIIEEVTPDEIRDEDARREFLKARLKPGEEIVKVDGLTVKEQLEKIYPYMCASTAQDRDLRAYKRIIRGDYGTVVPVTVRGLDGSLREVKLTCECLPPWPKSEFVFRKIGGDIGYVNIPGSGNSSSADEFDKLADQFQGLKGLIIDVRNNGGGNSAYGNRIISHLIDQPLQDTLWKTRDYRPAHRAWGQKEGWYKGEPEEVKPAEKRYFLGPIVLLAGPATYSAGEDFTVVLHAGKRATIVGEKTGGSTGQPLRMKLPMGQEVRICTKWDTYPDGREFVGVGIIPDVEIGPTPEDIAKGRDAVLEKGIEVLRQKMADS